MKHFLWLKFFFRREERRRDVSCELSFAITFTIWQTWTSIPLRLLECWKFRKQTRVASVWVRLNSIGSVLCFMLAPNCTQITIPAACACINDVNRLQTCRLYQLLSCYNGQYNTHLPAYGLVFFDSNENLTIVWFVCHSVMIQRHCFPSFGSLMELNKENIFFIYLTKRLVSWKFHVAPSYSQREKSKPNHRLWIRLNRHIRIPILRRFSAKFGLKMISNYIFRRRRKTYNFCQKRPKTTRKNENGIVLRVKRLHLKWNWNFYWIS